MGHFYEQRPMFGAVQFDGTTTSADEMADNRLFIGGYIIRNDPHDETTLKFTNQQRQVVEVKKGQWVVVHTSRAQEPLFAVMSDFDFLSKYEPVQAGEGD